MIGYIYEISNTENDKKYVGSTFERPLSRRWIEHLRILERNKSDVPLYEAMKEIGIDKFKINLIEEVDVQDRKELQKREFEVQKRLNVFRNGYNKLKKGMIGRVYKIINNVNDFIYIGSTIQQLHKRWIAHMSNFNTNRYSTKPLYQAFQEIGIDKFRIELIEEFQIDDQTELYKKEYEYQIKFNSIKSGYNKTKAPLFKVGQSKEYRKANIEEIKIRRREYENKNRETIKKKSLKYYYDHKEERAEKVKKYREENRDKVLDRKRELYQQNKKQIQKRDKETREKRKDDHLAKRKKNYQANRDKILEKRKEMLQSDKGDIIRARKREWERNNPEKRRVHRQKEYTEEYHKKRREQYRKKKEKEFHEFMEQTAIDNIRYLFTEA